MGDLDMDSNGIGFDAGSTADGSIDTFDGTADGSRAGEGQAGIGTGKSRNTADSIDMPEELSYSEDHVWVDTSVSPAVLGITAYAADKMGSLVYIDFPAEGDHVRAGDEALEVESAKAISPVSVPVDGTVRYINNAADEDPEIVNNDPYGEGWLIKIELDDDEPELLDSEQYAKIVKKQ
jgi:glycine cleavage system H protein